MRTLFSLSCFVLATILRSVVFLLFKPHLFLTEIKRGSPKLPLFIWYGRQDLNLHGYPLEPKSNVSANSTTPAFYELIVGFFYNSNCWSANSPVCGTRHLRRRRRAFLSCRPRHTLLLCFICHRQRRATRPRPHFASALFYHAGANLSTNSLSHLCQIYGNILLRQGFFVHLSLT